MYTSTNVRHDVGDASAAYEHFKASLARLLKPDAWGGPYEGRWVIWNEYGNVGEASYETDHEALQWARVLETPAPYTVVRVQLAGHDINPMVFLGTCMEPDPKNIPNH